MAAKVKFVCTYFDSLFGLMGALSKNYSFLPEILNRKKYNV